MNLKTLQKGLWNQLQYKFQGKLKRTEDLKEFRKKCPYIIQNLPCLILSSISKYALFIHILCLSFFLYLQDE